MIYDFFLDNYVYDMAPGATPMGSDFVTYFLSDQKRGYCAHFASAGVMLLRSYGIPARYAEGYVITTEGVTETASGTDEDASYYYTGDNPLGRSSVITTEISDGNAHAWAEVFVSGYGWIPVEVTNATLTSSGFAGNENETEPSSVDTDPSKESNKAPESSSAKQGETKKANTKTDPSNNSKKETKKDGEDKKLVFTAEDRVVFILAITGASIILLWLLLRVLFDIVYYNKVRSSMSDNYRKRILMVYKRIYRLTKNYIPITAESDMKSQAEYYDINIKELLAFKEDLMMAEFGNDKITLEECKRAERIENRVLHRINHTKRGLGKYLTMRMIRIRRKIDAGK